MQSEYDFLVIGGGSGGYAAARTACDHGLRTAVVDGAEELGGLCILRGCMPSKALIESGNRLRALNRAGEFGLRAPAGEARPGEIIRRKRALIEDFASYRRGQLESGAFDLVRGRAVFTGPDTVEVTPGDGGDPFPLCFRTACVATGSRIARVPVPGLEECGYWTSDDLLDAEQVPDSWIVLGAGAVALELACYLQGIGKEVTVIQRSDQLLTGSDRDVAESLQRGMEKLDGLRIFTGTSLEKVTLAENGRKRVRFRHRGETVEAEGGEILQALGRRPATDGLGLEAAGLELAEDGKHLAVGTDQRTSQPCIFAAGDVCGPLEVVHLAIEQGETAATNAAVQLGVADSGERRMDYRVRMLGIFTEPQVATVGLSETEARESGREAVAASYPFDDHGMSLIKGETEGFVKLVADPDSRELLGASAVGPEAVELIHEIAVAIHFRATAEQFLQVPHYHPSLSEIWTYPAEELAEM